MKREYNKPMVVFEDFSLTTNIAASCEVKTWLPSNSTCGLSFTGLGNVFLSSMAVCTASDYVESYGTNDGLFIDPNGNKICYHVPYGDNLFNS